MSRYSPPAFACRLFQIVLPVPYRGALLGDLIEEYNLRAEATSPSAATLWFWGQACRSIPFIVGSSLRNGVLRRFLARLANFATRRQAIDGCGKRWRSISRFRRRRICAPACRRPKRAARRC